MDLSRYKIPVIIILVVLIIAVFIWKKRAEKMIPKKNSKKGNKKVVKKQKKTDTHMTNDDNDNDNDDNDKDEQSVHNQSGNVAEDAKELFDLVHNDMASGMQIDAFEDAVGDLAGDDPSETFVNLKQKYTQAIDDNRDPIRSVTVKDYVQILQKS